MAANVSQEEGERPELVVNNFVKTAKNRVLDVMMAEPERDTVQFVIAPHAVYTAHSGIVAVNRYCVAVVKRFVPGPKKVVRVSLDHHDKKKEYQDVIADFLVTLIEPGELTIYITGAIEASGEYAYLPVIVACWVSICRIQNFSFCHEEARLKCRAFVEHVMKQFHEAKIPRYLGPILDAILLGSRVSGYWEPNPLAEIVRVPLEHWSRKNLILYCTTNLTRTSNRYYEEVPGRLASNEFVDSAFTDGVGITLIVNKAKAKDVDFLKNLALVIGSSSVLRTTMVFFHVMHLSGEARSITLSNARGLQKTEKYIFWVDEKNPVKKESDN